MHETRADSRPLRGLLIAQFLGAFNDHAWKLFVAFLAMRPLEAALTGGTAAFESASQTRTTLVFAVFILPFLLLSLPGGALADRLSKRSIIVGLKGVEVALMAAGTLALLIDASGWVLPLAVLGLMGAQGALFSPAKYGILPEILTHDRLSRGNGLLEMWTFMAIVAGTATGGVLLRVAGGRLWLAGLFLTGLSVAGFVASRSVPRVAPSGADRGLAASMAAAWSAIRGERLLWLTVLGLTWFWGISSLLGQDILVYARTSLGLSEQGSSALLALFGIGVGAGSLLAGRVSGSKVEYGLIPLGALLFASATLLLGGWGPRLAGTLPLVALLGVASGLLVVPLNALLQWRAPAEIRGAVIALANLFVFTGILAGSLAAGLMARSGLSSKGILVGAGLATVGGTLWAFRLLPDAFLRLVLILLTHTFYRLTVLGREHVPARGGALLVPNHVSFIDGLLIIASLDRRVRFVVEDTYFHHPLLKPFMKSLGAIPISAAGGPRVVLKALREAGRHLEEDRLVCIFAEGQVTRVGTLLPFRRGIERLVKGRQTSIIPVHLDRVWGSIFSRSRGRFLTKIPERVPYPVTVSFGAPLPAGTPVHEVRRAVQELATAAWEQRRGSRRPLHRAFLGVARRHPLRFAFADATRTRVSRLEAAAGAVSLARALRPHWEGQDFVGVMLPPSVAGALVNLGAAIAGKVTVNLNYTAGRAGMGSAAAQAGLRTVVTSRAFVEKAKLELPEGIRPIWLEDLSAGIGWWARLAALLLAAAAPARLVERLCGARRRPDLDDLVTVIFSSGSTGDPKGVMQTHYNVDSNVEAVAQVFGAEKHDRILGILPLFHSFGYLMLWFATNHNLGVVFHPNPLETGAIGDLVQRFRVTILVATSTFLQLYLRRCTPAQFGSLRFVLVGAEKLPVRLALAFEDQFGVRPLEGYGTTECSPAVAMGTPDFRAPGFFQPGSRRGSVGQPLPGVTVRVVDPDSFEPLPPGEPGMLLVRGPNVMKGYLGREDLTAKVMKDGWYVTGDIAALDEDGFLRITDRLSRFSKIGGEMVPHGRVEEALQEAAGAQLQTFAVTPLPDERKGERLVVLHTFAETEIPALLERLAGQGLPNLFTPRAADFVRVEAFPLLGTGKLDLRACRRIAGERLGSRDGA